MKKISLLIIIVSSCIIATAQQTSSELFKNAKVLSASGDYEKANELYDKGLSLDPNNNEVKKEYALTLCLQRNYNKALAICKTLLDNKSADVQTYQIMGIAFKGLKQYAEAETTYINGLKKFTTSGVLYNDYGELFALNNNLPNAIVQWEIGIEQDPNYSSNYYNATMYYNRYNLQLVSLLQYAELFINLESYSQRTNEVKKILLEKYQSLLQPNMVEKQMNMPKMSLLDKAILQTTNKVLSTTNNNNTVENIIALRAKFVLDWFFNKQNVVFVNKLFTQQQYFLKQGLFNVYNQWIFTSASNPAAYTIWLDTHEKEAAEFKQYQQSRVFKVK